MSSGEVGTLQPTEYPFLTPPFASMQENVQCPSGASSYVQIDGIIHDHSSHNMSSDEVTLDRYLEVVFSYLVCKTVCHSFHGL